MARRLVSSQQVYAHVLSHLLRRVHATRAESEPVGHAYFTDILPPDVYRDLLDHLPYPELYHDEGEATRSLYALTATGVEQLLAGRELWRGVAAALTAPALKRAVFAKLAPDLGFRFDIAPSTAEDMVGHARPTLCREAEGFELPPRPDSRDTVVTMRLHLPADLSQVGPGTALYRRKLFGWPLGGWQRRFAAVKQFDFRPNSGYAFVVHDSLTRRSWHGGEQLPEGSGVRNTLLNAYYATPHADYDGYLDMSESVALRQAA